MDGNVLTLQGKKLPSVKRFIMSVDWAINALEIGLNGVYIQCYVT